jgi:hypothetical protein
MQSGYFKALVICAFFLSIFSISAQETTTYTQFITFNIGYGFGQGVSEKGVGRVKSIGWQKSYGVKNKLRFNPIVMLASLSDAKRSEDQVVFFNVTTLGAMMHYDLINIKWFSLVTSIGAFGHKTRGIQSPEGFPVFDGKNYYFNKLYYSGQGAVSLRISPSKSRLAIAIRPMDIQLGNKGFIMGYTTVGVDIGLN